MNINYEVGKTYKFKYVRMYEGGDHRNYMLLEDPNNPQIAISVNSYSLQEDWKNITGWVPCYCRSIDKYGRYQFVLSRDGLLAYLYGSFLGHYQEFIIDEKCKLDNGKECFRISDPYGLTQFYFPKDTNMLNTKMVSDVIKLYVMGIEPSDEGKNNAYLKLEENLKNITHSHPGSSAMVIRNPKAVSIGVEDDQHEFKSSIAFPAGGSSEDMEQQLMVLMQTIAGFMNKDGGYLYIGVNDAGEPYKDVSTEFQYLNDDSTDSFVYSETYDHYKLKLTNKIFKDLGAYAATLVDISFAKENGVTYAIIKIEKAISVVWYQGKALYVRCNNCTRRMFGNHITNFILSRIDKGQFVNLVNQPVKTTLNPVVSVSSSTVAIGKSIPVSKNIVAWRYLSLYDNGQWMLSKKSVGVQSDMIAEIVIPKDPKKYVIMIAYSSGKVNAVRLENLLYGTGRNKNTLIPDGVRKNYGIAVGSDSIVNIFCMKEGGLVLVQSEVDGQIMIKAHNMESIGTHTQLIAQGNKIIPRGVLTKISPVEGGSAEKNSIEAMSIVVKDYERYHKNGVVQNELWGNYQELINTILERQTPIYN